MRRDESIGSAAAAASVDVHEAAACHMAVLAGRCRSQSRAITTTLYLPDGHWRMARGSSWGMDMAKASKNLEHLDNHLSRVRR